MSSRASAARKAQSRRQHKSGKEGKKRKPGEPGGQFDRSRGTPAVDSTMLDSGRIVVLDAHGDWLVEWDRNFAAYEIVGSAFSLPTALALAAVGQITLLAPFAGAPPVCSRCASGAA